MPAGDAQRTWFPEIVAVLPEFGDIILNIILLYARI